ncbi:O-antigen ligase family protein [Paenibacillus sp. D2_2]|uniref:O-antigen ligase family protein n=1 Tax=Paenibacillus sp. D2_2 TaxID=3073092 RepID=UPI002815A2F3|nr:O-antigen ligase family protein [Paenibacillus sp. D2_2]WMT43616.1 O-antigen ligase family protein [Paenibacillus sp. D2_2]
MIAKPVTDLGQQFHNGQINDPAKGWFYVLAASVIIAVIACLIQRYVASALERGTNKWASKKLGNLWLPVGSVVAVVVIVALFLGTNLKHVLPGNIGERLENINLQQHSVLERFTFYKDAVKVLKDYPVIGAGGGSWASIYEKYQNNPYTSRQAHSFIMQYLVEVGILGFVIMLGFMIFIFYKYIVGYIRSEEQKRDSYFIYFIIVLSILIHSLMDFNMSYVFIGMLVFIGLGGMAAAMDNHSTERVKLKASSMRGVFSTVMVLGSIALIFISIQYIQANNAAVKGQNLMSTSNNYQEIKAPLDQALKKRGNYPYAVLNMSTLLQAGYQQTNEDAFYNEEDNLLTQALKKEPFDKNMYAQLISHYKLKGETDKAYEVLKDNAERYAWDMNWYEELITQSFQLGYKALGAQDAVLKEHYFKSGLEAYQHVVDGVEHLKTLPKGQMQGNPFEVTQTMSLNAGKMQYMLGQPEAAATILKASIKEDLGDPTNQELARWYLAALKKAGQSDQAMYDQLIGKDPSMKDQISQLAEMNF